MIVISYKLMNKKLTLLIYLFIILNERMIFKFLDKHQ